MGHDLSKKSEKNLIKYLYTKTPGCDIHVEATHELEKRKRDREFWRKDVVAWLALGLSIISIYLHYSKGQQ